MTQKKKSFLPDFDHPEKVEQPDEKQREKLRKKYIRKLRWQKILNCIYGFGRRYLCRWRHLCSTLCK